MNLPDLLDRGVEGVLAAVLTNVSVAEDGTIRLNADAAKAGARQHLARVAEAVKVHAECQWRCFHCDLFFLDRTQALAHFGPDECSVPVCVLAANSGGLVEALRAAEAAAADAVFALHNESGDIARAYAAQATRHHGALVAAEESGYAKGMRDALKEFADNGCPHCGASDPLHEKNKDKVHPYRVVCRSCGCGTAWHGDYSAAAKAWKRRVLPAPAP